MSPTQRKSLGAVLFVMPFVFIVLLGFAAYQNSNDRMALQKEQDIICESKAEGQPFIADLQGNCFVKVK